MNGWDHLICLLALFGCCWGPICDLHPQSGAGGQPVDINRYGVAVVHGSEGGKTGGKASVKAQGAAVAAAMGFGEKAVKALTDSERAFLAGHALGTEHGAAGGMCSFANSADARPRARGSA